MPAKHVPPTLKPGQNSFTCPKCGTLAQQYLQPMGLLSTRPTTTGYHISHAVADSDVLTLGQTELVVLRITACYACRHRLLWAVPIVAAHENFNPKSSMMVYRSPASDLYQPDLARARIMYPEVNSVPPCHEDAFEKSKSLYQEAALVFNRSNRACASLIGVALEALLREHFQVQDMLGKVLRDHRSELGMLYDMADKLRLVRNDGSHADPRVLNFDENVDEIVVGLFDLFNAIVEDLIARPKRLNEIMNKIDTNSHESS